MPGKRSRSGKSEGSGQIDPLSRPPRALIPRKSKVDFIERELIGRPAIKPVGARWLVSHNRLGVLDGAAVLEVSGDAGRADSAAVDVLV